MAGDLNWRADSAIDRAEAERLVRGWPNWHHDFEILPGLRTKGVYDPQVILDWLELPADLTDARVLDIGPSDGFFTMQLARRGANVTAVDYRTKEQSGFHLMERFSGIAAEYVHSNLYDLPQRRLGRFDIVLFLGVLYHLPDPYRGLAIAADLCATDARFFLETVAFNVPRSEEPLMRFFPGRSLNDDLTNFWGQNETCVRELLQDVGFSVKRMDGDPGRPTYRLKAEAVRRPNGDSEYRKRIAYGVPA